MLLFLLVVTLSAGALYVLARKTEGRSAKASRAKTEGKRRPAEGTSRVVAPDDDEDFLRWLDEKRRKDTPGS
jgi:hypothetical protein